MTRAVGRIGFLLYREGVAIRSESIPEGLKAAIVNVQDAKAKALAYLEAKTSRRNNDISRGYDGVMLAGESA
jgi:hypothetical protein